ncbi:MAG TPA: hypothetical protein P5161_01225 [Eubacteriales bacterium]|nr:hypothetical protein [Clostridia bacterium]HRR89390.1 hypothetical protein [Eubacteriales bacterium]HRU84607.1 hypothetical protein [Eubacteriales bacterium]
MKKQAAIVLFIMLILTSLILTGCSNAVVVDGIKLSKTKIDVTEGKDAASGAEYKILKFACIVENTTDKTLSFEVVYSYRSGGLLNMSAKSPKQEIILLPGESKSLSYTTDKIYDGVIDQKKIYVQKVNQAPLG